MNELRYKYNTIVSDRTEHPARMFAPMLFSHLIREDRTREDRTTRAKVQIYNCFFYHGGRRLYYTIIIYQLTTNIFFTMAKKGIKPGQQLTKEHREAISRGHIGIHSGSNNPNYKSDRSQIKVSVTTISVTADVKAWLDSQDNKTQYILGLIREDMKRRGYTPDNDNNNI